MTTLELERPTEARKTNSRSTLDIIVLAGGPGLEREVSLNSGRSVYEALIRLGHRVELCDIGPTDLSALERECDIVFIALHGEFGEDGALQAELDRRRIKYTGSGADSSRTAMDKVTAKRKFEHAGVPTPKFFAADKANVAKAAAQFSVPAVVKPVSSGSSVDTTIVRDAVSLDRSVRKLVSKYGTALVEDYIQGPELTVGVLGDRALPVCQIRTPREFYDYEAKYISNDTEYLFEIDLPADLLQRVQLLSLNAHQALGCSVFSRVDWMIDRKTMNPYVLEVNTIPGFTDHSLLPKSAARVGLSFDALCQRIIDLSLERFS